MRLLTHRFILPFYLTLSVIIFSSIVTSEKLSVEDVKEEDEVTCDTPQGKLLGSVLKSRGGRNSNSFKAIPYAEIPGRFQPSIPGKKWEGTRNAKEYGMQCVQFFGTPDYTGSEDCLFLNVYSPNINPDAKLSVMVYIHGGGLQFGTGSDYNPEYFMDEDIVLVTFNYRLGVLGFLSTGDNVVPGNNGMKDQVLALQWVKKHISSFGGSPDKVTIFGESAGGSSASMHVFSKLSKGLFHNVIAMSGSAFNRACIANQQNPVDTAKLFGKRLNCEGTMEEMVDCLKTKELKSIMMAQNSFLEWFFFPLCTWSIVVESKSNAEAFLTDTPNNIVNSGSFSKVPYMTGITADEGLFFTAAALFNDAMNKELNADFKHHAPFALDYHHLKSKNEISEKLLEFYADGKPLENSTWNKYNDMFGDVWINHGVFNAANTLAKHTKVYPYIFSYEGKTSVINTFFGVEGVHGVAHADDLMYLFREIYGMPPFDTNSEDGKFSKRFVKSLAQFAKTGIPMPWGKEKIWKPINPEQKSNPWYNIKAETELEDVSTKFGNRMKFLKSLYYYEDETSLPKNRESKTEL